VCLLLFQFHYGKAQTRFHHPNDDGDEALTNAEDAFARPLRLMGFRHN
jgi:hypothetical protein